MVCNRLNRIVIIILLVLVGVLLFISFNTHLQLASQKNDFMHNIQSDTIIQRAPDALRVIHSRKSVRHFTDNPVSREDLEILVRAGMAAPSARNLQPWAFVIVNQRDVLDSLGNNLPNAKMLHQAQAAIVVCGDLEKASTTVDQNYWVQDCSAASQNILLAAEAIGLGAVWTAAFPYKERMAPLQKFLELPEHIVPLNIIPIGYPTGEDKPKDKWKPENMYWEKFSVQ
jgi:nitroreductase